MLYRGAEQKNLSEILQMSFAVFKGFFRALKGIFNLCGLTQFDLFEYLSLILQSQKNLGNRNRSPEFYKLLGFVFPKMLADLI